MDKPEQTLGVVEMPMDVRYQRPAKHANGHRAPMSERQKRKAAKARRAQLVSGAAQPAKPEPVKAARIGRWACAEACGGGSQAPERPMRCWFCGASMVPTCGFGWKNPQGHVRRCHLPPHVEAPHRDVSGAQVPVQPTEQRLGFAKCTDAELDQLVCDPRLSGDLRELAGAEIERRKVTAA